MIVLQFAALALTALGATAVVLTRNPRRQVVMSGFFGLALAMLFFAFRAPDVALSQIVVGTIAVPTMVLLALAHIDTDDAGEQAG